MKFTHTDRWCGNINLSIQQAANRSRGRTHADIQHFADRVLFHHADGRHRHFLLKQFFTHWFPSFPGFYYDLIELDRFFLFRLTKLCRKPRQAIQRYLDIIRNFFVQRNDI